MNDGLRGTQACSRDKMIWKINFLARSHPTSPLKTQSRAPWIHCSLAGNTSPDTLKAMCCTLARNFCTASWGLGLIPWFTLELVLSLSKTSSIFFIPATDLRERGAGRDAHLGVSTEDCEYNTQVLSPAMLLSPAGAQRFFKQQSQAASLKFLH